MTGFSKRALGLARALPLPLLVLTLTQVAIRTVARYCGEAPGRNRTWVHWDAYRYIDVARHGYVEASWDPLASNTGWFPDYPLALGLAAVAALHQPRSVTGMRTCVFRGTWEPASSTPSPNQGGQTPSWTECLTQGASRPEGPWDPSTV